MNEKYMKQLRRKKQLHHENPQGRLWRIARRNARAKGREFTIKRSEVIVPSHCPVLGIELRVSDGHRTDHSPSLDRVDSKQGYVSGNVVVVSWRANRLKSDATPEELKKLADFYNGFPNS